jgi:hypothetical protein
MWEGVILDWPWHAACMFLWMKSLNRWPQEIKRRRSCYECSITLIWSGSGCYLTQSKPMILPAKCIFPTLSSSGRTRLLRVIGACRRTHRAIRHTSDLCLGHAQFESQSRHRLCLTETFHRFPQSPQLNSKIIDNNSIRPYNLHINATSIVVITLNAT